MRCAVAAHCPLFCSVSFLSISKARPSHSTPHRHHPPPPPLPDAGVYVPTIVRAILKDPRGINLKGFAVGDGCMGTEVLCGGGSGPYWNVEFMHGHGQVSNRYGP